MLKLSFDLPPSLNRLYRAGRGKVYLSANGKAYKESTILMARSQMDGQEPLSGNIAVQMEVYGSRLDIDNNPKIIFDALNGVVWNDDSQIKELHIYRHPDDGDKRVELIIWRVDNDK